MEDPVPVKKQLISNSQLSPLSIVRPQLNTIGLMLNPLYVYQNQLTNYLLQNNNSTLNLPTILTPSNPSLLQMGSSLLYQNPAVSISNLTDLANQNSLTANLFGSANSLNSFP